jgi:hypothetical protein
MREQIQPARKRNSGYAKIYSRYYNQPSDQLPPSIRRTSPIATQPVTQTHRRERVKRFVCSISFSCQLAIYPNLQKRPIDRPPSTWFFENVASNPRRTYVEGEEHFKCLWPSVKRTETIQTVTRSMRGSLSGLSSLFLMCVPILTISRSRSTSRITCTTRLRFLQGARRTS